MAETLSEVKLNKRQIERIIENLKEADRARRSGREGAEADRASAGRAAQRAEVVPARRRGRGQDGAAARKKLKTLGLSEDEVGEVARTIAAAPRKCEAASRKRRMLPVDELKKSYGGIIAGERKAEKAKAELWRPTCAWWSPSPRSTPTAACSSWT